MTDRRSARPLVGARAPRVEPPAGDPAAFLEAAEELDALRELREVEELDLSHHHKSRDRAVVRNAGAAVFAKGTTSLSTILIFAIAAKTLTTAELGVVAVLSTISIYSNLGDLGLSAQLLTVLPEAKARGDLEGMRSVIHQTFVTLSAVGLIVAGGGAIASFVVSWPSLLGASQLHGNDVRLSVLVFFVSTGLSIPAGVVGRVLVANLRGATILMWTAAAGVASLAAVVACAAAGAGSPAYVFGIVTVPVLVTLVCGVWTFTSVFPELRPRWGLISISSAWSLLKGSAPYAVINVSTFVAFCIDSFVVSAVMGAEAAATYAIAARLFTLVGGGLILAGQQMWSALTDAISRGDSAWVRSRFKSTLILFSAINAFGCLVLIAAGRWFTQFGFGHGVVPPMSLLIVLGLYTVYSGTIVQASYLLIAMGKIRALALASALMAPLNLVLSIALTHVYGYPGPLLGSMIAITFTMAIPIFIHTRDYFRTSRELAPALA